MKLLIASTNSGKIREFRQMLEGGTIEFTDLAAHRELPPVEETGKTFRENACLKASEYSRRLKVWALADDSGLAVDALDGKPGVHSARWAELDQAGRGDADNNALLLRQLEKIPDDQRGARFVCVLALANPQGQVLLTAMESVEGEILRQPRGINGFGYDPLFIYSKLGKTTAELSPEEKRQISHRGKALRRMGELMQRAGLVPPPPRSSAAGHCSSEKR